MPATRCPACAAELTPLRKGGWFCEDCDRRYDAALQLMVRRTSLAPTAPGASRAPKAATPSLLPPPGPSAVTALPSLIATPLEGSRRSERGLEERLDLLLWAAYQIVRTTGLLLLSDYLASPEECRKVNLAVRALRTPDWWGWTVLCNQLVRFWSGELDEKPGRAPRLPRLVAGWRSFNRKNANRKESKWSTLLDGLTGRDGPAHSGNDALWHAFERRGRNGSTGEQNPEASALQLERIDRLVETAAHRLFPKDSLDLWRRVGEPHAPAGFVRLRGPLLEGRLPVLPPEGPLARGTGAFDSVAQVDGELIPLYPMLLLFELEQAKGPFPGGGLLEPILMDSSKKSAILGDRRGLVPRLVGPAIDTFREKKIDMLARENEVTAVGIAPWSGALLGNVLRQLRGRSYSPETYVERAGVDDALEAALQTPGRAVQVVGAVGSGKTSLFARLATRVTRVDTSATTLDFLDPVGEPITSARRGGDVVVLLAGRGAYSMAMERSGAEMLADAVARKIGVKEKRFRSLADLCVALDAGGIGERRRFWLLFDGIDEAEHAPELLRALDQFLPMVARFAWLRLCVSLTETTLRGRQAPFSQANMRYFAHFFHRDGHTMVPFLVCRPFLLQNELPLAYAPIQARRSAVPAPPLESINKELMAQPLLLSLLPVALPHLKNLGRLDEETLFSAYFSALEANKPELGKALEHYGEAMLTHRSVDLLAAAVERARFSDKGPPLGELVDAGLLLPPCDDGGDGEEAFVPLSQALPRELLLRTLLRRLGGRWPDSGELLGWTQDLLGRAKKLDTASPFVAMMLQSLEIAIQRMIRGGYGDAVGAVFRVGDDALRWRLLLAACIGLGRGGREEDRAATALFSAATAAERVGDLVEATVTARAYLASWGQHGAAAFVERLRLRALRANSAGGFTQELAEAQGSSMVELARLLTLSGQVDNARRYASDALRILRSLGTTPSVLLALGTALRLSGSLLPPDRRVTEGFSLLQEALSVLRNAEEQEPPNTPLLAEIAAVLSALVEVELPLGIQEEIFPRLTALIQTQRKLVASDPQRLDWQHDLGKALLRLASFEEQAGSFPDARRHLEDATNLLRGVVAREPRRLEAHLDLWRSIGAAGNLARLQGQRGEGLRLLEEAIEGLRWLQSQDPGRDDAQIELATTLAQTGALLILEGKRSRARRLLDEAVGLLKDRWEKSRDPRAASELATSLAGLGNLARVEGKQTEARQHFHEATRLWEALLEQETSHETQTQFAQALWSSSLVETEPAERRRYLEKLRVTLDTIEAQGSLPASLVRLSEMATRALAAF